MKNNFMSKINAKIQSSQILSYIYPERVRQYWLHKQKLWLGYLGSR